MFFINIFTFNKNETLLYQKNSALPVSRHLLYLISLTTVTHTYMLNQIINR